MVKPAPKQIPIFIAALAFLMFTLNAGQAQAFTNNRYLAYGTKTTPAAILPKPQVLGNYAISDAYITGLVTDTIDKMVAQGLLKGQKGDKGDSGSSIYPATGPIPVTYNSDLGGSMAGITYLSGQELTAGDLTVSTSLTVNAGAPVEIDAPSNFTASTTMSDLSVATIESTSGAFLSPGGVWTNASSRDLKENFGTTSPADILEKIDALPIYTWNYKKESPDVVHMGPVAEDFYSAFKLGNSSSSISTIDPAGVALAGIQGLDQKVKNLASSVKTQNLEVGSSDQPLGITIYDMATKQPVCIFSYNNVLQSLPGKCQAGITPNQNPAILAPPQTTQSASATSTINTLPLMDNGNASSTASSTIDTVPRTQGTSTTPSATLPSTAIDMPPTLPPAANASSTSNNLISNN